MNCTGCGSTLREGAGICLRCGELVRLASPVAAPAPVDQRSLGIPVWVGPGRSTDNGSSVRAGRFPRLMAAIVDLVIFDIITAPIYLTFLRGRVEALTDGQTFQPDWLLWGISVALLAVYLTASPLTPLRATPGKRLLGMRIVDAERGEPVDVGVSLTRSFFQLVFLLVVFPLAAMFALFGVISVFIAFVFLIGDGGSPWDTLAGTRVVD